MRHVRKLAVVAVATFWALPAQAQTSFEGAGQKSELDCDGGGAVVEGASNTLTIHGPCTSLTVTGAGNRITIDLAAKSTIRIEGADNEIKWRAPANSRPKTSTVGAGNRILPLR